MHGFELVLYIVSSSELKFRDHRYLIQYLLSTLDIQQLGLRKLLLGTLRPDHNTDARVDTGRMESEARLCLCGNEVCLNEHDSSTEDVEGVDHRVYPNKRAGHWFEYRSCSLRTTRADPSILRASLQRRREVETLTQVHP